MADTVKRALDLVSGYQDPVAGNKLDSFQWRSLPQVHETLEGLPEIPSHVENFGAFMDEMTHRALKGQMSPRDLIKAYAITRSSIRRQAIYNKTLREKGGFHLPFDDKVKVRPEGAMAEWLMTPMGQRYLDAAERGKVDQEAVEDAGAKMRPFGFQNDTELQALPWAAQNLPQRHKEFSTLIADGLSKDPNLPAWRKASMSLYGIKEAKSGFMGALLGRGDQPTLDARQIVLQTGLSNDEGSKRMANTGFAGVDRLAARQAAMNPKMDPGLEPFRQHLTHHAVWDKAGNDVTTHEDLMRAMRGAKDGGRIGYKRGGGKPIADFGHMNEAFNHPLGSALMRVMGVSDPSNQAEAHEFLKRMEQRRSSVVNPNDIWKINDPVEKARQIALLNKYNVDTSADRNTTGGYYNIKQGMAPKDVGATVTGIPNVTPKPVNPLSWEEALTPRAGGTLIGLGGDRSRLGRMTHINGKKLNWPVDLHAGVEYMLEPNAGQVWANAKAHASTIEKMIGKAAEKGPILGAFQPMGSQSVDSSHNMFDAVMAQINKGDISTKDAEEFDKIVKNGLHMPKAGDRKKAVEIMGDWPGINNPKAASEFARNLPGTHRAAIIKMMDKGVWRDRGFPTVGITRVAITNPELLNASGNMVGHRVVELDPDELMRNVRDSGFAHSTYTEPTGGRYVGDVPLMPRGDVFGEYTDAMLAKNVKGGHIVHPYGPTSLGQSTNRKMTEEQKPWGPINQQMIDRIGYAIQRMKRYGYKDGGAVQPTEAQKKAGNYQKHHVSFQGLPISLESVKGQTRSGVDPNGHKWSVKLPYHYGYIKRTEGADGDHVDVCIGPDYQSDHVFIIDQHDHRTGEFDEHKVMLGYRTRDEACRAYCAGFSDGKGPDRQKAVVRMSMKEFKHWLKNCDTKKPVRGQGHIDRAMALASQYTAPQSNPQGDRNGR